MMVDMPCSVGAGGYQYNFLRKNGKFSDGGGRSLLPERKASVRPVLVQMVTGRRVDVAPI
jgi:hypothetical protein